MRAESTETAKAQLAKAEEVLDPDLAEIATPHRLDMLLMVQLARNTKAPEPAKKRGPGRPRKSTIEEGAE